MASAVAVGKPTKGVKPNFQGVPGVFVRSSDIPPEVLFSTRKKHVSPYDGRLTELLESPKDAVLMFDNLRARDSLNVRSRKLGMKLEYGEHGGKLYVRLANGSSGIAPASTSQDRQTLKDELVSDHKTRNRAAIMSAMRSGCKTPEAISAWLRKQDDGTVSLDGSIVRSLLKHMQTAGTVVLKKISPETWEIAEGLG